jgi:hypothetical protein
MVPGLWLGDPPVADAAGDYKVVTANRFLLVDTDGKARAALSADKKNNTPKLMFLDDAGKLRMSLSLSKKGDPYINLVNGYQHNAVDLSVREDGSAAWLLRGADGSTAGSWALVKAKDGNWYSVLESGQVTETMK